MSVDTGKELFRLGFLTAIEIPDRGFVGGLLVTNHFGRPLEFQCTAPLKPNRTQEILYGPTLVPYMLGDLIGRTLIEKVGVKPHLVLTERYELLGLRELVEIPVACVDDMPANAQAAAPNASEAAPAETADTAAWVPAEAPVVVDQPLTAESAGSMAVESAVAETTTLETSIAEPAIEPNVEPVAPDVMPPTRSTPEIRTEASAEGAAEQRPLRPGTQDGDSPAIQLGRQMLRFHAAHADDRAVASRGARVVPNNADLREPFERVREALGETARMGGTR